MELDSIVESLVGRREEKEKKTIFFLKKTRDASWLVYPWIMDRFDNMGGGDLGCGNGDHKM